MKSKNPKIQNSKKVRIAVIITLVIITIIITYVMSNYKSNEISIAHAEEQSKMAKNVYTSELGSESSPYISNQGTTIYMDIDKEWGGDDFSYFRENTRKVTLKKYNEETEEWEEYSDIANGKYSYMLGDVNGDELVDEYDAAYIWGYLSGEVAFTEIQKLAADINGDGIINNYDYLTILYMDGTYYTVEDDEGNSINSKYLIGNPRFNNDIVYEIYSNVIDFDAYKQYINQDDRLLVGSIMLQGLEDETIENILLIKMLADYDMNYKVTMEDARYYEAVIDVEDYLEFKEKYPEYSDKEINSMSDQLKVIGKVEGKNYYDTSIVKMNTKGNILPTITKDGKYMVEITSLNTEEIQTAIDANKPLKENYSGDIIGSMQYMMDVAKYIITALKEIVSQIEAGTYKYNFNLYFDIDTTAPICEEIIYSTSEPTNNNVTATLKFSEAVKTGNNSEEASVQKEITFTENNTTSITYYDKAGNEITVPISVTNIDKQKPVMQSYTVNHKDNKIIVETIYNEPIGKANKTSLNINIGGNNVRGELDAPVISGNKVTYIYNVSGADGGKVVINLKGTVDDIAGNTSEQINLTIENDIALEKNVIAINGIEYSFSKNSEQIKDFLTPTFFKAEDIIRVTQVDEQNNSVSYEYKVEDGKYSDNTYMKYMVLTEPTTEGELGKVRLSTSKKTGSIDISEMNIYFDTTIPVLELTAETEELESNVYEEGTEIIIVSTTSEPITNKNTIPEINVSFSKSGIGKYNYKGENATSGNAKYIETVENSNGTITWKYKYIVSKGDEGSLNAEYISGNIVDYAGNTNDIVRSYTPSQPTSNYSDKKEFNGVQIKNIKFYTDSGCTKEISNLENSYQTKDIYIKVELDGNLYSDINTPITKDTAPSLYLNNNIETTIQSVSGKVLIYKYSKGTLSALTKIEYATLKNEKTTLYTEEDLVKDATGIIVNKRYEQDIKNFYLDPIAVSNSKELNNVKVDTTEPVLTISTNASNPTNADVIKYTFTWSEQVEGFTAEDITVINGVKGTLLEAVKNTNGTYSYTMDITTNTEGGNTGDIQVIVEQNVCTDLVGLKNTRVENIIRVDKRAAIIQSVEAYAVSNIALNKEIDVVKEYYKAGETIKVVATFDENISVQTLPTLNLQFNESGNAKGTITGELNANKIIYTYTIAEGDVGTVSIRSFSGEVSDSAGNVTKVTKRVLDGNTIIADTKLPTLKELKVNSPSTGIYKSGQTITIEAIYNENVYVLQNNEIKNISSEIAPILKVKFGNSSAREAVFAGYVQEDKTKLKYTVSIVDGDNGELTITSYNNKENVEVCDLAGNSASLNKKQTGNKVTADTERPIVQNITAAVENPIVSGTDIYYKEGNRIKITLSFNEEVSSAVIMPQILIGFSEEAKTEPVKYNTYAYESDWNANSRTIEYSYVIKDGENGYLWVKVPEGQFKDAAGNINIEKDAEEKSNIFADTTVPTVSLYKDSEEQQNNQTITIKATFNENIYDLNSNKRVTLTAVNAPKLIYSFGNGTNKEIAASSIKGAVITYIIKKDPVEDNGTLYYELTKGNLCDRAGNELYKTTLDTTAPILKSVEITSNAEGYAPYCKEGKEIYVTATFNEQVKAENIKLKAKVGKVELSELLDGQIIEDSATKVKFTYTVKAGDMGEFSIVDICGETDSKITGVNVDNTFGWVEDQYGNRSRIFNLKEKNVTATGKAEADTKDPYITSIIAKANEKEVAGYTKEDGKDAVITVGRTNANIVEYIVTYSEKVPYDHFENVSITNGIIKSIEYTNLNAKNEFKITVQTTVEGVQSLIINEGTVEDKAGNTDAFIRLNAVTVDFTKPTVRFISEYNGGIYVLPTNIEKVEIRPNVEISEDIAKIEYKWDNNQYTVINNYSSSSDIAIPSKAFTTTGQYKLFIRVVDLAGNEYETSKTYEIKNSNIDIELETYEYTNEDITATVLFGEGLTDNRKVTFKAEGSNELIVLNAIGVDSKGNVQYIGETNGTIYAEATDKVGNKVFAEYTINNIDKEAPSIEVELTGGNLVIGTEKNTATIKTNVETSDNNWVEIARFAFLQESLDIANINNMTTAEKQVLFAKINKDLSYEAKIENAVSTQNGNPYYLYVVAVDKAGNATVYKSNPFTIVDTNEKVTVNEETKEETRTPAEKPVSELIIFEQMKEDEKDNAYVYVNHDYSIIKDLDITLENENYGYVDEYNNVELYGNTKIIVKAWDACGNEVRHEYSVTDIVGPEFSINGNPEAWTNGDVELEVYSNSELKALTLNGQSILGNNKYKVNTVIKEYGNYTFKATDIYNNTSEQTIEVKVDKTAPEITEVKIEDGKMVITANDIDKTLNKELSGLAEYAITDTTEVPVEWSKSNAINVTKDQNFFVWAKDNAGNITTKEEIVVRDITAPELTITTDVKLDKWTNTDIKVNVKSSEELRYLVLKYKEIIEQEGQATEVEKEENILETKTYTIASNGTYKVVGTDKSGNTTEETIIVSKIDKDIPVISEVKNEGKEITITATDEGSGVKEYALTDTTEEPVEWSKSNVIKVTEDGEFYAWVKDNAGNVSRAENAKVIDITAPILTFNYLSQTITVGMPLEANITTNEEAIISYSLDNKTWVSSEKLISSLTVSEKTTTVGKIILYVKAVDNYGNESKVETLEFNVVNMEEIRQPEIVFEDIPTLQINGARYVKVPSAMSAQNVTDLMNKEALCGITPEYTKLAEGNKLKTGTEISINGSIKYVIIVNGDVNCDGKISPIDVTYANSIRLNKVNVSTIQKLAADFDFDGVVKPIDITMINSYRLGKIKGI